MTISRQPSRSANDVSAKSTAAPARERRVERGREPAHDAHRVQATDPGREGQPGLVEGERAPRSVDGQRQARLERRACGRAPGVGLGVGDLAVAVGVEAEACLEGRDLGLVDDDVEQDPVGLDADAGVVVDREVAERMRRRERRDDACGAQPGQGGEAARSVGGVGACRASSSWLRPRG